MSTSNRDKVLIEFAEELDQARAKLARIDALCKGAAHVLADDPQDVGAIVTDMALEGVRAILRGDASPRRTHE